MHTYLPGGNRCKGTLHNADDFQDATRRSCANITLTPAVLTAQPFLDPNSSLHSFFPAREWAIRLPAGLLLLGITGIGLFFAKVTMEEARKRAARSGKSA